MYVTAYNHVGPYILQITEGKHYSPEECLGILIYILNTMLHILLLPNPFYKYIAIISWLGYPIILKYFLWHISVDFFEGFLEIYKDQYVFVN
jgi:hypothetical protein